MSVVGWSVVLVVGFVVVVADTMVLTVVVVSVFAVLAEEVLGTVEMFSVVVVVV